MTRFAPTSNRTPHPLTARLALGAAVTLCTLALVPLALAPLGAAQAQEACAPRPLLLVVDHSSSMNDALPGGGSKWDATRAAVEALVGGPDAPAEVGLMRFPMPDLCSPGQLVLPIDAHAPERVLEALGGPPPEHGNYTPMAETLRAAAASEPRLSAASPPDLVLLTDGWQWCDPYDRGLRFSPIDAVRELAERGARVHVVGFGAGVDALTLNRAAVAGGSPQEGCDPDSTDPRGPAPCYLRAEDEAGLRAALLEIGAALGDERCNGRDDDCDGLVDEDFDLDGDGVAPCDLLEGGGGAETSTLDCDEGDPSVHAGAPERCNGRDDDCDGLVDPGCGCREGEERPCGSAVGACRPGRQRCVDGVWSACDGAQLPAWAEACDGVDDDCDGLIDEEAICPAGELCLDAACRRPEEPEPLADAGVGDAGAPEQPDARPSGACGCRLAPSPPSAPGLGVALLAAALVARRRRRTRGPKRPNT